MSRTRKGDGAEDAHAVEAWSDLERTLAEALPGFEVLDRELELPSSERADFVGVDGHGRLTLVLDAGGEGEEPVLRALDALAFARRNSEALARHLESARGDATRIRPELAPRVVLVAEGFSRKLIERLQPLVGHGVDLYELRTLRSKSRVSNWLTPAQVTEGHAAAGTTSEEAFLANLETAAREWARALLSKVRRLDPDVEALPARKAVTWRHGGHALGRLEFADGRLYAAASPRFESRPIESAGDVERFLEQLLGRYVEVLAAGHPSARPGAGATGTGGFGFEGDGAPLHAAVAPVGAGGPLGAGPSLTQAEYEAFRQKP
jgi:hypothetical protein